MPRGFVVFCRHIDFISYANIGMHEKDASRDKLIPGTWDAITDKAAKLLFLSTQGDALEFCISLAVNE